MSSNQNETQRPRVSMIAEMPQQWQYRQEFDCTPEQLDSWGSQGWRLVGAPVVARTTLGTSGKLLYVFERPVQSAPVTR